MSQMVTAAPPVTATFFSFRSALDENPTQRPSGEKNGVEAFCDVP